MDAEVKNEEMTDEVPILIEPKQNVGELLKLSEPNVELIDEVADNKYQQTIPHEYQDYNEQYDVELQLGTITRRAPTKRKIKCRQCSKLFVLSSTQKMVRHAVCHTNLYRFECIANFCGLHNWRKNIVESHVVSKHNGNMEYVKEKKLTEEEEQELRNMVEMCFPGLGEVTSQKLMGDEEQDIPMLIEPKKEVEESLELIGPKVQLSDEMDVKMEEIDDSEYQHSIPHEERPTKKIPAEEKEMLVDCQKCGNGILLTSFTEAKEHAATHTDLKSFKCEQIVDECFPGFIERLLQKTDEKEVKIEEDDSSYQQIVPYEYQDIEEEHPLDMPILSPEVSLAAQLKISSFKKENKKTRCQMCGKWLFLLGSEKLATRHAGTHTKLKRFECGAKSCDLQCFRSASIRRHVLVQHNGNNKYVKRRILTEKEEQELKDMVDRCFPENHQEHDSYEYRDSMEEPEKTVDEGLSKKMKCQKCWKIIFVKCFAIAKNHAVTHTNFKRFACSLCSLKSNYWKDTKKHVERRHVSETCSIEELEPTYKDEQELECMIEKCFPGVHKMFNKVPNIDEQEVLYEEKPPECKKCGQQIAILDLEGHAEKHLSPMFFKCDQKDCHFSTDSIDHLAYHAHWDHQKVFDKDLELMKREKAIEQLMVQCFSKDGKVEEVDDDRLVKKLKCQKCSRKIIVNYFSSAKRHAKTHSEFKRFACSLCDWKTNDWKYNKEHIENQHASETCSIEELEPTHEEELELECMIEECFPGVHKMFNRFSNIDEEKDDNSNHNSYYEEKPTNSRKREWNGQ